MTLQTDKSTHLHAPGHRGMVIDWSADKQAFDMPWGKLMMWIFLLSDTFIFSVFPHRLHERAAVRDRHLAQHQRGFRTGNSRHTHAPGADRHHDLYPDHQQRHHGDGGELRLQRRQAQNRHADGRHRAVGRVFRRHAGLRVDQADRRRRRRPWGNPMGAAQFGSRFS